MTKKEKSEYNKKYRDEHRDDLNEYLKEYRRKNKNKLSSKKKEKYQKNKDEILKKRKDFYKKNKKKITSRVKKYYQKNKDEILKKRKEYAKKYRIENKEKLALNKKKFYKIKSNREKRVEYIKNKKKSNVQFLILCRIRSHFNRSLKRYNITKTQTIDKYGIDIKAIIEKLGEPPNDGKVYHIDHILPVSAFDLTNPEHIRLCWHPDNLRWLEAKENIIKNAKYDKKLFEEYLK